MSLNTLSVNVIAITHISKQIMITIALAQIESLNQTLDKNAEQHMDAITDAIAKRADVIVFPEFSLHGTPRGPVVLERSINDRHPLIKSIASHSVGIISVVSGIESTATGLTYNTTYALQNGKILTKHRKLNIPTYGNLDEGKYYARGNRHSTFGLPDSNHLAGILTCADSWNPALVYTLALTGCHLLLQPVSSALQAVHGHFNNPAAWQTNIKHTAMTWGMFVVMVNRVGKDDNATFYGNSSVIDPYGNSLLMLGDETELAIIELDLDETLEARFNLPSLRDAAPDFILRLIAEYRNDRYT